MIDKLVLKIKEKKSLNNLDDSFVRSRVEEYLSKNKLDLEKKKHFVKVVKEIRNELNRGYGQFILKGSGLKGHKSSLERMDYYSSIYKNIFEITGKPRKVLDIGCGCNPLSYEYLGCKPKYICYEISSKDVEYLNKYFVKNKIKGKAFVKDITFDFKFDKVDVVFLFKLFDSVETKGHKLAERIILGLDCNWFVVSFATVSVKGQGMKHCYRGWFERLLKRLNKDYTKLNYPNEVFYVVKN